MPHKFRWNGDKETELDLPFDTTRSCGSIFNMLYDFGSEKERRRDATTCRSIGGRNIERDRKTMGVYGE